MKDIMEIVNSLEDLGLLIEGIAQTIEYETKQQRRGFLGMLLAPLGPSLLGNMLAGKDMIRAGDVVVRASDGVFGSK